MRVILACILTLGLACADDASSGAKSNSDAQTTSDSAGAATDSTTPGEDVPAADSMEPPAEDVPATDTTEAPGGDSPASCGAPAQDLEPVDCTQHGDVNAVCVFSNHCMCSEKEGFECEEPSETGGMDCAPGSTCNPQKGDPEGPVGSTATSCGSNSQGLEPVDCTKYGDLNAFCVFSNHCACSEQFMCEQASDFGDNECKAGSSCVLIKEDPTGPAGSTPTSCGAAGQGLDAVDCTQYGDVNASCVFSNHCMCSVDEGYQCEEAGDAGDGSECKPGSSCKPTT